MSSNKIVPSAIDRQALAQEPDAWQIRECLREVIEEIGRGPIVFQPDSSDWWEVFSHGLVQAIDGGGRNSFLPRCESVQRYVELESDFLRMDEEGIRREYGEEPKPIQADRDIILKILALRVVAFLQTRERLKEQGFMLPPNPDLGEAINLVSEKIAADSRLQRQFTAVSDAMGNAPRVAETKKKLPGPT